MARIALLAEGTYPFHKGGVAVWCDQLLRGLPEHEFSVYAVCSSQTESSVWDLPPNIAELVRVPLWEGRSLAGERRVSSEQVEMLERFFSSLFDEQCDPFTASLQELLPLARDGELGSLLLTRKAVALLLARLSDLGPLRPQTTAVALPPPVVGDAVDSLRLLERFLVPLGVAPPQVDVVHAVANGLATLVALSAKWEASTPFLLTEHGLYLRERYLAHGPGTASTYVRLTLLGFFRQLVRAAYAAADLIAPGSRYNMLWEEASGADPGRIRPVHNGIDPAVFDGPTTRPVAVAGAAPEQEGSVDAKAPPTVAFVGRLDPLKDIETLLRAFAVLRRRLPTARLRIFGTAVRANTAYFARCQSLARNLGLDPERLFEGHAPSVADAYRTGDVVVLSSISEGFPYTVLEAMAAGKPVVATDVGGVREAVGDAGIVVPPRDPEALAAACLQLLETQGRAEELGVRARQRVRSLFTVERCNGAYRDLYQELCGAARLGIAV